MASGDMSKPLRLCTNDECLMTNGTNSSGRMLKKVAVFQLGLSISMSFVIHHWTECPVAEFPSVRALGPNSSLLARVKKSTLRWRYETSA